MSEYVYAGLTSQTIDLFLGDSSSATGAGLTGLTHSSAGLKIYYRTGAAGSPVEITLTSQTPTGAWTSGGFCEISAADMPGIYRLDLPNAAVDTAGFVTLFVFGAANLVPTALRIDCRALPADLKLWRSATPANLVDTDKVPASVQHLASAVIAAAAFASNALDSVWSASTRTLTDFSASFKTGYSLSAAGIQAIWDALTSALTATGSIGKYLIDSIDALLNRITASRASHLDNLNVGGPVASQSEVAALQSDVTAVRDTTDQFTFTAGRVDANATVPPEAIDEIAGAVVDAIGDDLEATVSGFTPAALAQLSTVEVRLVSRQPRPGRLVLYQYDAWNSTSQLVRFEDVAGTVWPDMELTTPVVLRIESWGTAIEVPAQVVNGTGPNKLITAEIPRSESGKLPKASDQDDPSVRVYQLIRSPGTTQEWVLDDGQVVVGRKIPSPE